MDYIFRETLGKLIDLEEIKMVDACNKKVISTSIFIPENPSVSCKTFAYFTDLIKSVETFSNTGLDKWVYRIYVDDMFFSGISQKELESAVKAGDKFGSKDVEEITASIEKDISASSNSSPLKKTKKSSNIVEDKDSQFDYNYNRDISDGSMSSETKKTVKAIRNELKKPRTKGVTNSNNVLRLKKMMKLLNLYLKVIQESKSPRYTNIEIVRYNCNKVKLSKKNLPGHPSTFG